MSKSEIIKVVLLGDSGVGKTSIVERFVYDKFKPDNPSTLGVMFVTKIVDLPSAKSVVKINVWDTAGQEKYHSIAASYCKDAKVVFVIYDATQVKTFEAAKAWLKEAKEETDLNTICVLVGNKIDCLDCEEVNPILAQDFATENGMKSALISAKDGIGVNDLFVEAAEEVIKKRLVNTNGKGVNGRARLRSTKKRITNCC